MNNINKQKTYFDQLLTAAADRWLVSTFDQPPPCISTSNKNNMQH